MEKLETTAEPRETAERLIARAVRFAAARPTKRDALADLTLRLARLLALTSRRGLAEVADDARTFATEMFAGDRRAAQFLAETVADLDRLAPRRAPKPPPRPVARRGDFGLVYAVVKTGEGELLVEAREGEMAAGPRKGFRVTRADYDAAIAALAGAKEPLKFGDLHKRFVKAGGQDVPSQYPLRTVLRFWRLQEPPLVEKERARYSAADPLGFSRLAAKAWKRAHAR